MKFKCYPICQRVPDLRPAVADRDWMDETDERHAYRCLPLSIANSAGWEILNPVAFSAIWDGGSAVESVQIRQETDEHPIAIAHFGAGVLTFHVNALFETEENVQLWVGGSPNKVKDAIQPLTGIVETEWSPYSFTMNWKFTRPNKRVFFAKDEPFCFLMPLRLDFLEAIEPETHEFSKNAKLKENFETWSESRDTFNSDLDDPDSEAAAKRWQKSYHQGRLPSGEKAKAQHRTRVRVKSFPKT